ncbi:MAG: hypothetical protein H0X62_15355, partial [Bacteroidetes bacterium]|nr:hypothetical protein [Bacteroidota bacterium]
AINPITPWENNFGYEPSAFYQVPENLLSGVYLWDGKVPMVVKNKNKHSNLLVIVPIATLSSFNAEGGKSFKKEDSSDSLIASKLSLSRPLTLDKYSNSLLPFLKDFDTSFNIGYVSDTDLEEKDTFKNVKTIVIYGYSQFWTPTSILNLKTFIKQGGNVISLTSTAMNNKIWFDRESKQICVQDCDAPIINEVHQLKSWDDSKCFQCDITGGNYTNGGVTHEGWGGFKIINPSNPLLEGSGLKYGDTLFLPEGLYSGIPDFKLDKDSLPIYEHLDKDFHQFEIVGMEKVLYNNKSGFGIFSISRNSASSGIIINFGSREWCNSDVLNNPVHEKIIINAFRLATD